MEVRQYLRVIRRWWWLTALGLVVTAATTMFMTSRQPFFYESEGTLVVRPRFDEATDNVRAIDTLSRGAEINSTFAAIAESGIIKERARETLPAEFAGAKGSVSAEVIPGTNIIEISVTGGDPEAVASLALAVVSETVGYIETLNDVFTMEPLDLPRVPSRPAGPNKMLNNALGVILGLVLGGVLAFGAEYLSQGDHSTPSFEIIDPETHAFNQRFFEYRSDQELARGARGGRPFSVGLLKLSPEPGQPETTTAVRRELVKTVQPTLRREDVLAYLGDDAFAILFPDTPDEYAEACVTDISEKLAPRYAVTIAVCQYGGPGASRDDSLDGLLRAT